ncbi:MAG TPA: ATP-binding protein [Clostridia bacterium]|nr:ATP-binding protein [Clostridia bacterium]
MKPISLRKKLTLTFLMIALLSLSFVGLFANVSFGKQFEDYAVTRLNQTIEKTVTQITDLYTRAGDRWNASSLSEAGMALLIDGIILRVADETGTVVWDAQVHNNGVCLLILENMAQNMRSYQANFQGGYEEQSFPAVVDGKEVGTITVGYYGPYYFNEADLQFLNSLNRILMIAAAVSLGACVLLGAYLARRLSKPITAVIAATGKIAEGNYSGRLTHAENTTELVALSHSVNSLAATLESQEALRKQLTADVAHELRTPLTTLQSTVEAMLDGVWAADEVHLSSLREEILRLNKLVNELGTLSKYESEPLVLSREPFDLQDLCQQTIRNFKAIARQKGITLTCSGLLAPVFADRDKIGQILINLLHNALKFTPAGGTVSVETSMKDDRAALIAKDTGCGIAPEHLPFIFERFYRADPSRARTTGGSGIGLAIALAIAKAHGGEILVESTLGFGSAFTLILPNNHYPD